MLGSAVARSLTRLLSNGGTCKRFFETEAKPNFNLKSDQLAFPAMQQLKRSRFGEQLVEFKSTYEAPLVKLYAQIQSQKVKEARLIRNKHSGSDRSVRKKKISSTKAAKRKDDSTAELDLQSKLKAIVEEPEINMPEYMLSHDPRVQTMVEDPDMLLQVKRPYGGFDLEAAEHDRWFSVGSLSAAQMPDRIKLHGGDRWRWEREIPYEELVKVISPQILSAGLPIRDDIKVFKTALDLAIEADFENQSIRLSPPPHPTGIQKTLNPIMPPVDIESPAVKRKDESLKAKFGRKNRSIRHDSDITPFVLETEEYPSVSALTKRHPDFPVEHLHRKVKLHIRVDGLDLPSEVRERLIELAGPRYKPSKRSIVVISDTFPNRLQNKANVFNLVSKLFNEAWKADLNYVELNSPLMPHDKIQLDLDQAERKQAIEKEHDPVHFAKDLQFTIFKVPHYPSPNSVENSRNKTQKLIEEFQKWTPNEV